MNKAIRIDWTESERGWGSRPDGVTLHKDMATARAFIDAHWLHYQERYGDITPDEYTYPHEPVEVAVSDYYWSILERDGSFWVSHRSHIADRELLDAKCENPIKS